MHGWTFWIVTDGTFRTFDVFLPDFDQAERAVLDRVPGGKVDSYTRQPGERMRKICQPCGVIEFWDTTPKPRRGAVVRGSRADTPAARK